MKNELKKQLMQLIVENNMNIISFENHITSSAEVGPCDFTIKLLTNKTLKHVLRFNCHCKLLSYTHEGDVFKFDGTHGEVNKILAKAKAIYKSIVGSEYYK